MNLTEKIGQMMVFGFKAEHPARLSDEIVDLIKHHHVGGIILFGRNIGSPEDVLLLTTRLQRVAKEAGHKHPLLICTDQENGVVRRLGDGTTVFPGSMLLGATKHPSLAHRVGEATGKELGALGINWNLAPTVDVNNNPQNPVINVRSFGENPDDVGIMGAESMKGMQRAGIITTLKHFPGHGDTNVDSHLALPVIPHTLSRLEEVELVPFKRCIEEGADVVMTSHISFPALEKTPNLPATLSGTVLTDLLRKKLGFQGVITTDCMEMDAISKRTGTDQGAVKAILAGADLVMISNLKAEQYKTLKTIQTAVKNGTISEQVINEAWKRIDHLKQKYLRWEDVHTEESRIKVPSVVGCKAHQILAQEAMAAGVTIVKNDGILPLSPAEKTLVIYPENGYLTMVEDKRFSTDGLKEAIERYDPDADSVVLSDGVPEIVEKAKGYSLLIVGTVTANQSPKQQELLVELMALNKNIIVVAMRSPYDLSLVEKANACIATYEFNTPALQVAADAIYGKRKVTGHLPVTIE
ncbi:glycoside hydrolase family 3 protein [Alteribacter aurantiacus]|uniref:glycoside hydrolase family 3 protein n=1 Tax=Alteribacter aurantiacus TaxID=254410 RepID=UPI0004176664|nr:glycoside hydrolase family 3 protein [Alteribacter aurantiacus]